MTKFPLLEQMRAQRQRREDEVAAPIRGELDQARSRCNQLQRSLDAIQEFMGKEIAKHVLAEVSNELQSAIRDKVYEAVRLVRHPDEPVTITIAARDLCFSDPDAIESRVLREYAARTLPMLSARVDQDVRFGVTKLNIRVPDLAIGMVVPDIH